MSNFPERALVGALLHLPIDDTRKVREQFERDDLDDARLRIVVDLIDDCCSRGVRPDPVAVFAAGRSTGTVPAAGLNALGRLVQDTSVRLSQAADSESLESVTDVATSEAEAVLAAVARLNKRVTV